MRVGICQVDGKWPNLALAKIAAWHKAAGDEVEWFNALAGADAVYASKVFSDTPDNAYLPEDAIVGGSGYDDYSRIPLRIDSGFVSELEPDAETHLPDWSLWPWWDRDMGFTTRGCVRHCPFCIVPDKEGPLRVVASLPEISTGRREMVLLDANITAAPFAHFRAVCEDAQRLGIRLDFSQGFDARLLTKEHAQFFMATPHARRVHMAFDHVRDEDGVVRAVALWKSAGLNTRNDLNVFVLIGFDSTPDEDLYRVECLRRLDANPFVMPYNRGDRYQRAFARWVNRPALFRSATWAEYSHSLKLDAKEPTWRK